MTNQNPSAEDISPSSHTMPLPSRAGQERKFVAPQGKRPAQAFSFNDEEPEAPAASPRITPLHTEPIRQPVQQPRVAPQIQPSPRSAGEKSPVMTSVELPSQFFFYPFKEIAVGNVRIAHQAKFARAAAEESTQITCEAVSSLLSDDISALDLTIPDFFWILYWLRLNNYSKNKMTYKAVCSNRDHLTKVENGELPAESLVTTDIVNKTDLKETQLDIEKLQAFLDTADVSELTEGGYVLSAPTMRDTIELEDKWLGKDGFSENEYLADLASCIRPENGERVSLEDRMAFIGNLSPDSNDMLAGFRDLVQSYGVEEKISTKCKGCGAVVETEVSITAYDFL